MYRAYIQNPEYYHEPFYELNGTFEKSNVQYQLPEHTTNFQELQMIPQIPETPCEPLYEPIGAPKLAEPKEQEISLAQENVRKLFDEMQNPKIDASKKNEIGKRLFDTIDVVQSSGLAEHTHEDIQIIEPIPESPPLSSEEMKIREEQMARYQVPVAEFQENRQPVGYLEQPIDYRQSQRYQWAMRIEQADEYQEIGNFEPAHDPYELYEPIPKELSEQRPLINFKRPKSVDTAVVAAGVLAAIRSLGKSQSVFSANVLSKAQGTLSDLLKKPSPWKKLRAARETYLRMDAFLQLSDGDRRRVLEMEPREAQAALGFDEAPTFRKVVKPSQPRRNFTEFQKAALDDMYQSVPKPSTEQKAIFAQRMGLTFLQIHNYFQNRRRRERREGCQEDQEDQEGSEHPEEPEDSEEPVAKRQKVI